MRYFEVVMMGQYLKFLLKENLTLPQTQNRLCRSTGSMAHCCFLSSYIAHAKSCII